MLRRRIWLFLMVLILPILISPKKTYAGTCSCTAGVNQIIVVNSATNNCDSLTEFAQCSGQSAECICVKKTDSELKPNTCVCSNGNVTDQTCSQSTPNALCVGRGNTCQCSLSTNLNDVAGTAMKATTTNNTTDPFCPDGKRINTALGCIPISVEEFIPWLLNALFGVAGGIAFLLMVYGFILLATSSGDEKKVAGAKETISSAIIGLLVCIFSIFILRLIAVNILQIPGIN